MARRSSSTRPPDMLRNVVLALGLAWLAVGLWVTLVDAAGWPMLIFPAILVAGIVFERVNYRGNATTPLDANWRPTNERFLDEATGRPITVWFNAATGERRYVDD
jgi:hypothetical protein